MTPQMSANVTTGETPAGIVLTFAPAPLEPIRPPVWPWAVAASAGLGLLVGFYLVVRVIEQQGERRRLAVAAHEEATWRCHALPGRMERASCLARLNAPEVKVQGVQLVGGSGQR